MGPGDARRWRWADALVERAREVIAQSRNYRHAAHLRRALAAKRAALATPPALDRRDRHVPPADPPSDGDPPPTGSAGPPPGS
jgi:hypothetical protein